MSKKNITGEKRKTKKYSRELWTRQLIVWLQSFTLSMLEKNEEFHGGLNKEAWILQREMIIKEAKRINRSSIANIPLNKFGVFAMPI